METNFETAVKEEVKDEIFAEPWSTHFIDFDEASSSGFWLVLMGPSAESICITDGELDLYNLLDDENKAKVREFWKRTRKPYSEWKDILDVPYQSWNNNF